MRFAYLVAVVGALLLAGACTTSRPGYCQSDSECSSGQHCQLGSGVDKLMCVPTADAGGLDGGGDALDSGGGCQSSQQCPSSAPICSSGVCTACGAAAPGACSLRDSAHPVCAVDGTCVQCTVNSDCSSDPTKPICETSTNTCGACATDAQCAAKGVGPGVCMAHQDGRCATDAETAYVQFVGACSTAPNGGDGSSANPFCSLGSAILNLPTSAKLILVIGAVGGSGTAIQTSGAGAQLSIIGQASAKVISLPGAPVPNLIIQGASVYLRGLTISGSGDIGLSVSTGAMIELDTVTFDSNSKGGLLIDSSGFDIRNSTFTNNGPGDSMGAGWGGIRVQGTTPVTKTLEDDTISMNKQIGLSCAWAVTGTGVYASGNTGGIDVSSSCAVTTCPTLTTGCGAAP